jgi:LAO/AO transport system kinase
MASRGSAGGLALATADAVRVLDAAGFDLVVIETVGAGQAEVEIARTAHTTLVVEAPGMGDDVQAIKAGILEIADILVVNKADLPGAENAMRQLRAALALGYPTRDDEHHAREAPADLRSGAAPGWVPDVLATSAFKGTGITELIESIARHLAHLDVTGARQVLEQRRARREVEALLQQRLVDWFHTRLAEEELEAAARMVAERRISPRQAVDHLTAELTS